MTHYDLNGDGVQELLLAGTSNAFRQPVLAVLDPRVLAGHGPVQGAYRPADYVPGTAMYYVRFPFSPVGQVVPFSNPLVSRIRLIESDSLILATVLDAYRPLPGGEGYATPYLIHLSYDLAPVGISTSSEYMALERQLMEQGLLSEPLGAEGREAMMASVSYWDGDGWRNEPVMNRHYRAALARRADASRSGENR